MSLCACACVCLRARERRREGRGVTDDFRWESVSAPSRGRRRALRDPVCFTPIAFHYDRRVIRLVTPHTHRHTHKALPPPGRSSGSPWVAAARRWDPGVLADRPRCAQVSWAPAASTPCVPGTMMSSGTAPVLGDPSRKKRQTWTLRVTVSTATGSCRGALSPSRTGWGASLGDPIPQNALSSRSGRLCDLVCHSAVTRRGGGRGAGSVTWFC